MNAKKNNCKNCKYWLRGERDFVGIKKKLYQCKFLTDNDFIITDYYKAYIYTQPNFFCNQWKNIKDEEETK